MATHIYPFQVNDDTPSEAEVEASVRRLPPFKAGKHTHLHTEHLEKNLHEAYHGEGLKTPP